MSSPAKAGTHNHRCCLLSELSTAALPKSRVHGVWVPAFAGTTEPSDRLMCANRNSRCDLLPAEHGGGFSRQRGEHQSHHVAETLVLGLLLQEIAAENHAQ